MKRIIFGLGSNLGDRKRYLEEAIKALSSHLNLLNPRQSAIIENKALLPANAPTQWNLDFFNLSFSADIDLEKFGVFAILRIIKEIERNIGRKEAPRWAPREIDIDILTIEDLVVKNGEDLIVPHYDLLNRDFFIKTIKEIEPNWQYPIF